MSHSGEIIAALQSGFASFGSPGQASSSASYFKILHQELKGLVLDLIQSIRAMQDLSLRANAALPINSSVRRQETPKQQEIEVISNLTAGLEALAASFDSVFSLPKSSNLGPPQSSGGETPSFHPASFSPLLHGYLLVIGQIISTWIMSYGEVWDIARAHAAQEGNEIRRQAELKATSQSALISKSLPMLADGTGAGAGEDDDDQETAKMEEVWRKKVRRGSTAQVKAVTWKPLSEEETAGLEEKLAFKREALAKCEAALMECEEKLTVAVEESVQYRTKMEEFGASLSLERLNNHQRALASSLLDTERGTPGRNTISRASASAVTISSSSARLTGDNTNPSDKKSLMAAMSSILSFKRK